MRSRLLLPALLLMSACSQSSPPVAQDVAAEEDVVEDTESEAAATQLAITDCAAAGRLAGDLIAGMEPTPKVHEDGEGQLICAWWNTQASSSFSISVSTGGSDGTLPDILDTVIQKSGQSRVQAPAFEAKQGGAGWELLVGDNGHRTATLHAYLPDAHVILIHILPVSAGGSLMEPTHAVKIAGELVDI